MAAGLLKLTAALAMLAAVWLVALPWAAARPRMAAHLEWLDEEKIDPSAMYYTELEMMQPIFTKMAQERRAKDGGR